MTPGARTPHAHTARSFDAVAISELAPLALLATCLLLCAATLTFDGAWRIVPGFTLALILPGWLAVLAYEPLLPRRLGPVGALWTIATSIAFDALIVVALLNLHVTPSRQALVVSLAVFSTALAVTASLTRRRLPLGVARRENRVIMWTLGLIFAGTLLPPAVAALRWPGPWPTTTTLYVQRYQWHSGLQGTFLLDVEVGLNRSDSRGCDGLRIETLVGGRRYGRSLGVPCSVLHWSSSMSISVPGSQSDRIEIQLRRGNALIRHLVLYAPRTLTGTAQ